MRTTSSVWRNTSLTKYGLPFSSKRFLMDASKRKQNWLSENINSRLVLLTDQVYPRIKVTFGGNDAFRDPMEIEAEDFVGVKGYKARGKRLTTYAIATIEEIEPTRFPEKPAEPEESPEEPEEPEEQEAPEEPVVQEEPEAPEAPVIPENPEDPETPEAPEIPEESNSSENADNSDNSDNSEPSIPPKHAKKSSRKKDTGQLSLFDDFEKE